MAGRPKITFSPEIQSFIKKNYMKMYDKDLAEAISTEFEVDRTEQQVMRCRQELGLHKPRIRKAFKRPEDFEVKVRLSVRGAVTVHRCI